MNPEWKNKLSLLHKRMNENDTSTMDDEQTNTHHYVREDESMRPLSFKGESVALMDPALSIYNGGSLHSPFQYPSDATAFGDQHLRNTSMFMASNMSMLGDDEMENDFTITGSSRHDDSSDNVNQGTPTKQGDTSGCSSKSTPSSGGLRDPVSGYSAASPASALAPCSGAAHRSVNESHVLDYDPYLKAVEENCSYASDGSRDGLDRHIIKTLDFGASVDYQHDDLSVVSEKENSNNVSSLAQSRSVISPHLSTPPRTAAAAIGNNAMSASPPPRLGARGSGGLLKPPSASSPASPEIRGNSSFNKTPSRIPLPSRGVNSGTRVSPTQERSTSKFADALKRHGQAGRDEDDSDVCAPQHMSRTTTVLSQSSKPQMTPQSRMHPKGTSSTPATLPGAKPPTPAPTPLQLPPSRHSSMNDAAKNQGTAPQRPETAAFTEGFDEWKEAWTPVGKIYYYNRRTRKSSWRLPPSAIHVKVAGEPDKIFVPMERSRASEDDVTKKTTVPPDMIAEDGPSEVDPLAETVVSGAPQRAAVARANSSDREGAARGASTAKGETSDWGNTRQVFKAVKNDPLDSGLKPIVESLDVDISTPAVPVRPPPNTASAVADVVRLAAANDEPNRTVLSEMKCKTLLFCPLCADVILPQRFGSHFKECPEIATLAGNGEYSIVLNALSDGFSSFSKEMGRLADVDQKGQLDHSIAAPDPFVKRPETSPMPNRVLDFGGPEQDNETSTPTHQEPQHTNQDKPVVAEHRSRSAGDGLGNSVPHNQCAFCGKPSSKSALSAHLLVCKSRKEMQMKRQSNLQYSGTTARGNASAGRTRATVSHRRFGQGTPQRGNGRGAVLSNTLDTADGDRQSTGLWGASTPADNTNAKAPSTADRENMNKFISPAGVSDAITSGGRGPGVVKAGVLKSASKVSSSSPMKGKGRASSAQKGAVKPLGEHQSNIGTPNRTITTRVFM